MSFGSQTHRPIAQLRAVTNPTVDNITSPVISEEEFTLVIPDKTKKLLIRCRDNADIKMNFTSIDTINKWVTIPKGASYSDWGLDLTSVTIYLKVTGSSKIVEVLTWI